MGDLEERPASIPRRGGPVRPGRCSCARQAEAILACDFFTADLLDGTQAYVLAVIEHASRRIRILGVTLHPTGEWTAQQARNLIMDLGEQANRVKFMIRDHGSNFTSAFNAVLADAGIRTVLCNVRTPRMNAIAERWIGGCPARAPGPHPRLEPGPSAADSAHVRDPPQSAPAAPLPGRSRAAETPTRTGRSRLVPRPTAGPHRLPDQRIPPGRMTWTTFFGTHSPGASPVWTRAETPRACSSLRMSPGSLVDEVGVRCYERYVRVDDICGA